MKVALDTNVLAYVEGVNSQERRIAAVGVVDELRRRDLVLIPVQAVGELYNVLVRKAGWPAGRAQTAIWAWHDVFPLAPTTPAAMLAAVELAKDHGLRIWDSVMISVAAENGCRLLLSEDLQDGFSWRGLSVANPFATSRHPLLEALLAGEIGEGGGRC
jgi:predicted nucleic acid-binding protein